jgi:hypothetical protein
MEKAPLYAGLFFCLWYQFIELGVINRRVSRVYFAVQLVWNVSIERLGEF